MAANLTVAPSPLPHPSYLETQLSQVSLAPNSLFPVLSEHQGGLKQQGPDCGSVITVGVSVKLVKHLGQLLTPPGDGNSRGSHLTIR